MDPLRHAPSSHPLQTYSPRESPHQREAQASESVDLEYRNTTIARCHTCVSDRKGCSRQAPNQNRCDRCQQFNYPCSLSTQSLPVEGRGTKRRKLALLKCEACRCAKIKCMPEERNWPEKCDRCRTRNLPCSEPQLSSRKRTCSDRPKSESEDDRSRRMQVETQVPAYSVLRDTGHFLDGSQRISDVTRGMKPPRNDLEYKSLKGGEIRLVILHHGSSGDDISCDLVTTDLQNGREYEALSYMWQSDDAPNKSIIVKDRSREKTHPTLELRDIGQNLYSALRELRDPDHDKAIWVRPLCINQDEEATQVSKMIEIYNRASKVVLWLGPSNKHSELAFNFIGDVSKNLKLLDGLVQEDLDVERALATVMRNELFNRRWVIQDLAVARDATVRCGKKDVPWSDFSDAVALFQTRFNEIQGKFPTSKVNRIYQLGACKIIDVANNIVRKSPDGKILNRLQGLESLVSTFSSFETEDPRDAIFALLGLAKDGLQLQSIFDRTILDVYVKFVNHCVQTSGNIDIICRHWAPARRNDTPDKGFIRESNKSVEPTISHLPSWIPDVTGSAFGDVKTDLIRRVNGDSFVGTPDCRIYNAASGLPTPIVTFGVLGGRTSPPLVSWTAETVDRNTRYDGTMFVQGYTLGKITELTPRAVEGIVLRECLKLGGWNPGSKSLPERLWRTLVADRGPENTKPPSWYHRACLHALSGSSRNGDINTTELVSEPEGSQIVAEFLRRVQSVIWNRRFFLSGPKTKSYFGLGPEATEVGDLICILYGCSVPVILREHKTHDDRYYEMIGESFVYGMMDGEAHESLTSEEIKSRTVGFKLR